MNVCYGLCLYLCMCIGVVYILCIYLGEFVHVCLYVFTAVVELCVLYAYVYMWGLCICPWVEVCVCVLCCVHFCVYACACILGVVCKRAYSFDGVCVIMCSCLCMCVEACVFMGKIKMVCNTRMCLHTGFIQPIQ